MMKTKSSLTYKTMQQAKMCEWTNTETASILAHFKPVVLNLDPQKFA
jgi:hypothetical protein